MTVSSIFSSADFLSKDEPIMSIARWIVPDAILVQIALEQNAIISDEMGEWFCPNLLCPFPLLGSCSLRPVSRTLLQHT